MVVKLKSISKRIHWSLVLKAAVFALAWVWFPFWLFSIVALYLYFAPLFQARRLAVPFFTLLLLCYLQTPGTTFAVIFGSVFYAILLIKDLLLIDRRSAYELLVLVLTFLLLRDFYSTFNGGINGSTLIYSFLIAGVFVFLARSFIRGFAGDAAAAAATDRVAVLLFFLLFWQILIAGLFLPVDFIYQSVTAFLVAVLLVDLVPEYLFGNLSRTKILAASTVIFALFVIVLGSARWGF
jgi:hypothetical protein